MKFDVSGFKVFVSVFMLLSREKKVSTDTCLFDNQKEHICCNFLKITITQLAWYIGHNFVKILHFIKDFNYTILFHYLRYAQIQIPAEMYAQIEYLLIGFNIELT